MLILKSGVCGSMSARALSMAHEVFENLFKTPTQSKIMKARVADDKELPMFIAMQDLVQMVGRSVREDGDWSEQLCIDDNCTWFVHKYRHFSPSWCLQGYRSVSTIPDPPRL